MATKQREYIMDYAKKTYKRLPIDFRKDFYDEVLTRAAELEGMPITTFIKTAIKEKIERDGLDLPDLKA